MAKKTVPPKKVAAKKAASVPESNTAPSAPTSNADTDTGVPPLPPVITDPAPPVANKPTPRSDRPTLVKMRRETESPKGIQIETADVDIREVSNWANHGWLEV